MADYIKPSDPESLRAFIVALIDELPSRAAAVSVTAGEQSQITSLGNAAVGSVLIWQEPLNLPMDNAPRFPEWVSARSDNCVSR